MLRITICELVKLKRKKFIMLVTLAAFLFPIPITMLMTTPRMLEGLNSKKEVFGELFTLIMGYGIQLLLPCVLGVIAAILFFEERDNDTFKNLRTIPVTGTQMVFAKIIVLFTFGIFFSIVSAFAAILCGSLIAEVDGVAYKLLIAVKMGIFITAGTLPLIVFVVCIGRTYIFSVLLCVFYSVLSLTAESTFGVLPKMICYLMPIPLTTLWCVGDMVEHGIRNRVEELEYLIPSTFQTVIILGAMAFLSVVIIDYFYGKKEGE